MQFMIYSTDKIDGGLDIRKATRDAHLAWLSEDKAATVLAAGPWLDTDGTMRGSLLIVECESRETLDAWTARDPYARAGLSQQVIIHPYKLVITG